MNRRGYSTHRKEYGSKRQGIVHIHEVTLGNSRSASKDIGKESKRRDTSTNLSSIQERDQRAKQTNGRHGGTHLPYQIVGIQILRIITLEHLGQIDSAYGSSHLSKYKMSKLQHIAVVHVSTQELIIGTPNKRLEGKDPSSFISHQDSRSFTSAHRQHYVTDLLSKASGDKILSFLTPLFELSTMLLVLRHERLELLLGKHLS